MNSVKEFSDSIIPHPFQIPEENPKLIQPVFKTKAIKIVPRQGTKILSNKSKSSTPKSASSKFTAKPSIKKEDSSSKTLSKIYTDNDKKNNNIQIGFFRKCLQFFYGFTGKLEKTKILFGMNTKQDKKYSHAGNKVKTTKYTIINWFPKSLLIQFLKSANIYFLIITILTAMPFSPKLPQTMILTFSAVLFFTQLKEAYEDYYRYKQDSEVNAKIVWAYNYSTSEWIERKWKDLTVGELVKIEKDQQFPADLLFMKCSEKNGISFVDTMNLDGETNLKEKIAVALINELTEKEIGNLKGEIICDSPNEYLEKFDGKLTSSQLEEPLILESKQLLLRGSTLKNTKWIIGLTIYCGIETKSNKNSRKPRNKFSKVLVKMNKILYTIFLLQAFICLICSISSILNEATKLTNHVYLNIGNENSFEHYMIHFFVNVVAYSQLIPISLYVALEIVKLVHSYLIAYDYDLFYEELKKKPIVKNSDLIEELGQVEFLFSDKTGTLTSNIMEFKKCMIGDTVYGENPSKKHNSYHINGDSQAYYKLSDNDDQSKLINDFFRVISICHTVVIDCSPDISDIPMIKYQASSPDELALVEGARNMGFQFINRDLNTITLQIFENQTEQWETILEFPFDSARKRMSLLVKNLTTNVYYLLVKGADSTILPRLKDQSIITNLENHLNKFAVEGLRTLVIAKKQISEKDFKIFFSHYEALKILSNKTRGHKLLKMYDIMESNLELVGISGIEDKLQEKVPETIEQLIQADIRIWVLTGDKQETAIEIGKSCKLIQSDMELIDLSSHSKNELIKKLKNKSEQYDIDFNKPIGKLYNLKKTSKNKKISIVINGQTLSYLLEDAQMGYIFFRLGIFANSCICCRVSPKQKADVVKLVKLYGNWITLAIGDGANDVSMITEANIGIGIFGKEGTQAARASDFAICRFHHLRRLLLLHGRWNYRRISNFICYYFYKNCAMVFTEIFFAFYNGFSGQIFFLEWLPMLFNAIWTSWPCMINACLDQDLDAESSLKYPKLYKAGACNYYFNMRKFWVWIGFSFWHGMCCFLMPVFIFYGSIDSTGDVESNWWVSTISFSVLMHVITIKLFLESSYWTTINITFGILSIILYYLTILLLNTEKISQLLQPQMVSIVIHIIETPKAWIIFLFLPWIILLPDIIYRINRKINLVTPAEAIMKIGNKKE